MLFETSLSIGVLGSYHVYIPQPALFGGPENLWSGLQIRERNTFLNVELAPRQPDRHASEPPVRRPTRLCSISLNLAAVNGCLPSPSCDIRSALPCMAQAFSRVVQISGIKSVDVTVKAGRICLECSWDTGEVSSVISDGHANYLSFQVGWRIKSLDGIHYSEGLLREKAAGTRPYVVTFSRNVEQTQSETLASSDLVCSSDTIKKDEAWDNQAAIPLLGPKAKRENMVDTVVSQGTVGHPYTCASACKFYGRARGCKEGAACPRCHLCKFKNVKRNLKKPRATEEPAQ